MFQPFCFSPHLLGSEVNDLLVVDSSRERRPALRLRSVKPVAKVRPHSKAAASRLTVLLVAQICPIFSLLTSCQEGASAFSVLRRTFATGC